jgi:hypothetical protein
MHVQVIEVHHPPSVLRYARTTIRSATPVSSLEFGPQGWVQSVNFILTGTLVTLFGWGVGPLVHRLGGGRTVTVLLMAVGIGLLLSLAPLSSGEGKAGGLVVEQGLKDGIGEAALEYPKCLASAVPTALAPFDHPFGRRMPTGLGECDAV